MHKRSMTEGVPAEAGQMCVSCESVGTEYKIRRTNIFVYGGKRVNVPLLVYILDVQLCNLQKTFQRIKESLGLN